MEKLKIIILSGLPASGKSTYSKQFVIDNPNFVRINKDDLRIMSGNYYDESHESYIATLEMNAVKSALRFNLNVILDSTNLIKKYKKVFYKIAADFNCDIEEKYFDVPLDVCIERDSKRTDPVGADVITKMFNNYNIK